MSDRVVVLNDGQIEQVGTTGEVYNRPANTFVATFIGNPSINYLDGTIDSVDGDSVFVSVHGVQFNARREQDASVETGDAVTVGIRPQHVDVVADPGGGHFSGELTLFEPVDDRAQTTIDGPEGEFRAVTAANASVTEGDEVGLDVDEKNVLLFDGETNDLIARSTRADDVVTEQTHTER